MSHKYFAYDQDHGFETFETENEAIEWSQDTIDSYRDNSAGQEWDEAVSYVVWGEIKQHTVGRETGLHEMLDGELVENVDYALEDVLLNEE